MTNILRTYCRAGVVMSILCMTFWVDTPAYAAINMIGNPYPSTCGTGGVNTHHPQSDGYGCPTVIDADTSGVYMWGVHAQFQPGQSTGSYVGNIAGFVLKKQSYRSVLHLCTVYSPNDECTASKSYVRIPSALAPVITPSTDVSEQRLNFGGPSIAHTTTTYTKACYSLLGEDSVEYTTRDVYACADIEPLPPTPATCTVSAQDLSVVIPIDRTTLSTSGSPEQGVGKKLSVTCTGDLSASYSIALSPTTPLNAAGTAITTSADGLGIAMYYDDQPLTSASPIKVTYSPGTTDLDLKFVPVRDPNVPAANIPTGTFKADAVMIMTEE